MRNMCIYNISSINNITNNYVNNKHNNDNIQIISLLVTVLVREADVGPVRAHLDRRRAT